MDDLTPEQYAEAIAVARMMIDDNLAAGAHEEQLAHALLAADRDAKRYRWLRECQSIPANILLNHHAQLDAAIDAAIGESK